MRKLFKPLVIVISLFIIVTASVLWTKPGCSFLGGKWGSAVSSCTTPWCYYFGGCGDWAVPSSRCANVSTGDSIAKVVFELGDPASMENGRLSWPFGKGSSEKFDAQFGDGKLVSISCKKDNKPENSHSSLE